MIINGEQNKTAVERAAVVLLNKHYTLADSLNLLEETIILAVMIECNGNQTHVADILGMHRNTLSRKVKKYQIKLQNSQYNLQFEARKQCQRSIQAKLQVCAS